MRRGQKGAKQEFRSLAWGAHVFALGRGKLPYLSFLLVEGCFSFLKTNCRSLFWSIQTFVSRREDEEP